MISRTVFVSGGSLLDHVHPDNRLQTCQKCHPAATRRCAGYLTHATHHDPQKYPWLFYTFWAMTGLLVVTFASDRSECAIYESLVARGHQVDMLCQPEAPGLDALRAAAVSAGMT